jgi:hypothetical protein
MRASRYKDGNFPLIPAYYLVISYRVSAAELRLLKTVAKDMYGELDLIDARAHKSLSLMIRFSINYWLYYSIWSPSGHLRERGRNCSRPSGSI